MNYNDVAKSAIEPNKMVGSVQKLFGLNGEVVVKIWDNFPENISEPLWVEIDSLAVPLFIKSFKNQGAAKAVIVFDDFENESLAEMLVGLKLYSLLVDVDEEIDLSYLESFTLKDITSGRQLKIEGYIESELNPLLELEGGFLVPIAQELIEKVNEKKKIIEVRLAEGIFDL